MNHNLETERSLRRRLRRHGFDLRKTPARSPQRSVHPVGYMIVDSATNAAMAGASPYSYSADIGEVTLFAEGADKAHVR